MVRPSSIDPTLNTMHISCKRELQKREILVNTWLAMESTFGTWVIIMNLSPEGKDHLKKEIILNILPIMENICGTWEIIMSLNPEEKDHPKKEIILNILPMMENICGT